jgi:hypothetical protein
LHFLEFGKVEKILKGSLDSISSPSPSVKIQIKGGKVCLRCKVKTLLETKSLLTSLSNGEGDSIESGLSSEIFSTLCYFSLTLFLYLNTQ